MVPYGGFWWRVLAYLIDFVILYIAMTVVLMVFGLGMTTTMALEQNPSAEFGLIMTTTGISLVMNWLYFAALESSPWQGTVGKMAVGLVVTDVNGNRITFLRATGRYFAKILSGMILGIGYLMVGFTERKQGLHDIVASTLIYKTRDPREAQQLNENVFA